MIFEALHAQNFFHQKSNHHESETVKINGQFFLGYHSFIGYCLFKHDINRQIAKKHLAINWL
jgi:hypothetical protein